MAPCTPSALALFRAAGFAFLFLVSACGGGGSSNPPETPEPPFAGNWYNATIDRYLSIRADNTATHLECSSQGYRKIPEGSVGTLEDTQLTFGTRTYLLQRDGDSLTMTGPDQNTVVLARHATVPSVCTGNYIEITAVTPDAAAEGSTTSFKVDFTYQLSSNSQGVIDIGFNTIATSNSYFMQAADFKVTRGQGTGTLTASIVPIVRDTGNAFSAYAALSDDPHPSTWSPLSSDSRAISVTSAQPTAGEGSPFTLPDAPAAARCTQAPGLAPVQPVCSSMAAQTQ